MGPGAADRPGAGQGPPWNRPAERRANAATPIGHAVCSTPAAGVTDAVCTPRGQHEQQSHPGDRQVPHLAPVDILPRLKSGDSYGAHPGIEPE